MRTILLSSLLALLLWTGSTAHALPDAAAMHERVVMLKGDPGRPVSLQTTILTPDGPGPFPAVVFNHGADNVSRTNRNERFRLNYPVLYFLSRGYAVILPMARGFAGSGGELDDEGCDLALLGMNNARDIASVVKQVAAMPFVRPGQIVVAGQSYGGWTTLAYSALDQGAAQAAIAFSPTVRTTACPISGERLIAGAREFGARAHLRTLWFYGDTDRLVPKGTWHAMVTAYAVQGPPLKTIDVGSTLANSHALIASPKDFGLWVPQLTDFLASIGLPSTLVQPQYMPNAPETASHFADITDVGAVPYINAKGQAKYRDFLAMRLPRALVIAPDGAMAGASGGSDPAHEALTNCQIANLNCALYAVDNDVVWKGAQRHVINNIIPPNAPIHVTKSVVSGNTLSLGFSTAMGIDCKPTPLPILKIVQQGQHGHVSFRPDRVTVHYPQNNFRSICNGKTAPGTRIEYTADPGYIGDDHVIVDSGQGQSLQRIDVSLRVY